MPTSASEPSSTLPTNAPGSAGSPGGSGGSGDAGVTGGAPPLSGRLRRSYAIGGLATGSYGTVPGLLLLPYLTDTIGISAAVAGLVVFLPKAWDFFLNPVAGRISDRSTNPAGRRRPFLLWAGLALAVGFALIFTGPTQPQWLATVWVLVAFIGAATAYAFFQVPYLAMAAEMTDDYQERTRMMMWRVIVITIAIMISGATAPLVVDMVGKSMGAVHGYRAMGVWIGFLIVLGTLLCWHGTRKAPLTRHEQAGGRLGEQLKVALGNEHARTLLTCFVLQAVASTMLLAGVAYVARYLTGGGSDATLVFVTFVGPAVIVAPVWERIAHRYGKKFGYTLSSWVIVIGLLGLLVARTGSLAGVLVCSAIVGVGYAGCQLFPLAMLPDVAADDTARSGINRIGVYSGVWAGMELLGFALGPAVYGLVLTMGGYVSATGGSAQPSSALWAITLGLSAIPAALVMISLVFLSRYRLDEQLHQGTTAVPPVTA